MSQWQEAVPPFPGGDVCSIQVTGRGDRLHSALIRIPLLPRNTPVDASGGCESRSAPSAAQSSYLPWTAPPRPPTVATTSGPHPSPWAVALSVPALPTYVHGSPRPISPSEALLPGPHHPLPRGMPLPRRLQASLPATCAPWLASQLVTSDLWGQMHPPSGSSLVFVDSARKGFLVPRKNRRSGGHTPFPRPAFGPLPRPHGLSAMGPTMLRRRRKLQPLCLCEAPCPFILTKPFKEIFQRQKEKLENISDTYKRRKCREGVCGGDTPEKLTKDAPHPGDSGPRVTELNSPR